MPRYRVSEVQIESCYRQWDYEEVEADSEAEAIENAGQRDPIGGEVLGDYVHGDSGFAACLEDDLGERDLNYEAAERLGEHEAATVKERVSLRAACKSLVAAYDASRGGSMDWDDVDTAYRAALEALGWEALDLEGMDEEEIVAAMASRRG